MSRGSSGGSGGLALGGGLCGGGGRGGRPEQIAATKSGFAPGRSSWAGTAERRAAQAVAAARAATGDSRTGFGL